MTQPITKIVFVHEGKAAYPEIAAYRSFFAKSFQTTEAAPSQINDLPDLETTALWYMMGFYPKHPVRAACVVHDYRSLSIGTMRGVKDKVKRYLNARPDIRIFQNAAMRDAMGFHDGVATLLLPMGVPSSILSCRAAAPQPPDGDFCYIGVMSMERKSFLMFDSFLRRFGAHKTFHAYGDPEPAIYNKYKAFPQIVFHGKKNQDEVFEALRRKRVAVNYFPTHAPHALQTPTKLLEYGALGLRLLCNEHPQSRLVAEKMGLSCLWGASDNMFAQVPETLDWPDNQSFDPAPLLWPHVITQSGIAALLWNRGRA